MSFYGEALQLASPLSSKRVTTSPLRERRNLEISVATTAGKKTKKPPKTPSKQVLLDSLEEATDQALEFEEMVEDTQREADMRTEGYENLLQKEREKTSQIAQQFKEKQREIELRSHELELRSQSIAAENNDLKQKAETAGKNIAELQTEKEEMILTLQESKERLEAADKLSKEYEELERMFSEEEQDNERLSNALNELEQELSENEREITAEEEELGGQVSDIAIKKQQIITMNSAVKQAKEKLTAKNAELAAEQDKMRKMSEEIEKARTIIENKAKMGEELKKDNEDLSTQLETLDERYEASISDIAALKTQSEQQRNAIIFKYEQELKGELMRQEEQFEEDLNSAERVQTELKQQLAQLKKDREEAQREADESNAQMQMLELQMNEKATEISVLQTSLDELRIRNSTKDKIIEDTSEKLDRINEKLGTFSGEEDYRIQLTQLRTANEELRAKLRSAIAEGDDNHISTQNTAVQTLKQLSQRNAELEDDNLKAKMQIEELQSRLVKTEKDDSKLRSSLEIIRSETSAEKLEYQESQEALRQLKVELSESLDQIQEYELGFQELESAVLKNDHDGSVKLIIEQIKDEAEEAFAQLERVQREYEGNRSEGYHVKAELEQKDEQITRLEDQIDALRSDLRCLQTSAQSTTTEILDYEEQVNVLNEFKQNHTDCELIKSERDELRLRVHSLEAQATDLQHELELKFAQEKEFAHARSQDDRLEVSELQTMHESSHINVMEYNDTDLQNEQNASSELAKPQDCATTCMHAQENVILQQLLKDTQDKFYELEQEVVASELAGDPAESIETVKNVQETQEDFDEQVAQNRDLYETQIARLNDELANLMQENQSLRARMPGLENDLEQSEYLNENYENEIALKTRILSQVEAKKAEMDNNYENEMFENQKLLSVNKKLQEELRQALEKLESDNEVVQTFKEKLQQLGQLQALCGDQKLQIEKVEYERDSYKEEMDDLERRIAEFEASSDQLRGKEAIIRQEQSTIDELKLDLSAEEHTYELAKQDKDEFMEKAQKLSLQLIENENVISELQGELLEMSDLKAQLREFEAANEQIKALNEKLTVMELENLSLNKKLNETSDEKLKLQSSNIMLINIHREQIENNLQLNFKLNKDNMNALLDVLEQQKQWNLQPSDILILCDRKFISNKALEQRVVEFIKDKNENNLSSSFFRAESFFTIEELTNYSDSLKLALKRSGVQSPQELLRRCFQIYDLVQMLENHLFVLREIADLVQFPADFSRETSLVKQNHELVLRDSKSSNLLSSCHISDYIFIEEYKQAVMQKAKCNWKKCENRIYQIIKEALDLASIENEIQPADAVMLERYGLIREKRLFEAENLAEEVDFNLYYGGVCWLMLMEDCEISRATTSVGYERILGENDDELYELCYPAVMSGDEVVARALGVAVR